MSQDDIATVVMHRPPVKAQSNQLRQDLIEAFGSFTDRDDVRETRQAFIEKRKPVFRGS